MGGEFIPNLLRSAQEIISEFGQTLHIETLLQDDVLSLLGLIVVGLILFPIFHSALLFWRNEVFKHALGWTLLEIHIPREIQVGPRAMEQVLLAIHGLRNAPGDFGEYYLEGEITRWYSFEIVSFGGEIHFYIRCYYKQRGLVEAAFYSYYKDVELVEVEDYTQARFPQSLGELYEQGYDMWATEFLLARPEAYPIRSYRAFEANVEEKEHDPVAALIEVMGKIQKEEILAMQINAAPAHPRWRKEWRELVEELRTAKKKAEAKTKVSFEGGPLPTLSTGVENEEELRGLSRLFMRTPGETDVLKAVEENLSKQAFHVNIRCAYFSPKSIFYDSFARRATLGSLNQYADLSLNYFRRHDRGMSTRTRIWNFPYLFPRVRNDFRKQRLLWNYRHREMQHERIAGKVLTSHLLHWNHTTQILLTTDSLATLFHLPSKSVLTAPHIPRVESRKGGPPAGLAIFGEEEKLQKFL